MVSVLARILGWFRRKRDFEVQEIAVKELVDKKIAEAITQHEEDYVHAEREITAEEIIAEKEAWPTDCEPHKAK